MKKYKKSIQCTNTDCPLYRNKDFIPCEIRLPEDDETNKVNVLFVGDAPSRDDAYEGSPFAGTSGDLLRRSFKHASGGSEKVGFAFSNVVRCHPVDEFNDVGRVTSIMKPGDIEYCKQFLLSDIETLDPEVIVLLGNVAIETLTGDAQSIGSVRGQIHERTIAGKARKVTYTWHPNYVRRNSRMLPLFNQDVAKALRTSRGEHIGPEAGRKGEYILLDKIEAVEDYIYNDLGKKPHDFVSFDVETVNLNKKYGNRMVMIQFATDGDVGYCIPYMHYQTPFNQGELDRIKKALQWLFTSDDVPFKGFIAHGSRFEHVIIGEHILDGKRIRNRPVLDTVGGAFLLDENKAALGKELQGEVYGLKHLLKVWLGFNHYEGDVIAARQAGGLHLLPLPKLSDYGAMDAYGTWRLFMHECLLAKEQNYYKKWIRLLAHLFSPVYRTMSRMEVNGCYINLDHLRRLQGKDSPIFKRMLELEMELRKSALAKKANEIALDKINNRKGPGSMKALFGTPWVLHPNKNIDALFIDVMGLHAEKTKTGLPSISKAFYKEHQGVHEVDIVSEWSQLQKLGTAYVNQMTGFIDPECGHPDCIDSRVRPDFRFDSVVTGRTACKRPNLQQLPKCWIAGTRVQTDQGLIAIEDVAVGMSTHMGGKVTSKHSRLCSETIYIESARGYRGECTPEHRLMVWRDTSIQEIRADQVTTEDYLLVPLGASLPQNRISTQEPRNHRNYTELERKRNHPYTAKHTLPDTLTPALGRLLGYLVSEGQVNLDKEIKFSNKSKVLLDDYIELFKQCFGVSLQFRWEPRDDCYYTEKASAWIRDYLYELGLTRVKACAKRVPHTIMRSPKDVVVQYLASYLAGDGNVQPSFVRMHTGSIEMAVDMQTLLAGLGLLSSVFRDGSCWAVALHSDDARAFVQMVPTKAREFTFNYLTRHPSIMQGLRRFDSGRAHDVQALLDGMVPVRISKIERREHAESIPVYEINTESHVYTANGLLSHNCEGHPARIFIKSMIQADQGKATDPKKLDWKPASGPVIKVKESGPKFEKCLVQLDFMASEVRWWCGRGDMLVNTTRGLLRLDEIAKGQPGEVVNVNESCSTQDAPGTITHWASVGKKACLRVQTHNGFEFSGGYDHKVLTFDKRTLEVTYKRLDKLTLDDHIVIKHKYEDTEFPQELPLHFDRKSFRTQGVPQYVTCPICSKKCKNLSTHAHVHGKNSLEGYEGPRYAASRVIAGLKSQATLPTKMTEELAEILGLLVSEGYIGPQRATFSNTDLELIDIFVSLYQQVFKEAPNQIRYDRGDGLGEVEIGNQHIVDFLKWLGVTGKAEDKTVPWSILQAPRACTISFLRGYWEGDGYAKTPSSSSVNKELTDRIQLLLLRLGIVCSRKIDTSCKSEKAQFSAYFNGANARKFFELMSFKTTHRRQQVEASTAGNVPWIKSECIPGIKDLIDRIKARSPDRRKGVYVRADGEKVQAKLGVYNAFKAGITREQLTRYPQILSFLEATEPAAAARVRKLYEAGYVINPIRNIEDDGEHDVYDITVKDTHNYVANGFINHNCIMSGDANLAKAFNDGKRFREEYAADPFNKEKEARAKLAGDIHKMTASLMFGVPVEKVKKEMRSATKSIVFGWMYGRSTKSIAAQIGKSIEQTQELCDQFAAKFPTAAQWLDWAEATAAKNLWIESPIYRRRRLDAFMSGDDWLIAEANRLARNSPIQSISSDGAMIGSALFADYIEDHGKPWRLVNSVHDSSVTELPIADIQEMIEVAKPLYETGVMNYMSDKWGVVFNAPVEVEFEVSQAPRHGLGDLAKWDFAQPNLDKIIVGAKDPIKSLFILDQHLNPAKMANPDVRGIDILPELQNLYPDVYMPEHAEQFDAILATI